MANNQPNPPETNLPSWETLQPMAVSGSADGSLSAEQCQRMLDDAGASIFGNSMYRVTVFPHHKTLWGPFCHISIRRVDRAPIHDWADLQEIKNDLFGPEFEAIEIYPSEKRVVDAANQYHLWVFGAGMIPVGFADRAIAFDFDTQFGSKQRRKYKPRKA